MSIPRTKSADEMFHGLTAEAATHRAEAARHTARIPFSPQHFGPDYEREAAEVHIRHAENIEQLRDKYFLNEEAVTDD